MLGAGRDGVELKVHRARLIKLSSAMHLLGQPRRTHATRKGKLSGRKKQGADLDRHNRKREGIDARMEGRSRYHLNMQPAYPQAGKMQHPNVASPLRLKLGKEGRSTTTWRRAVSVTILPTTFR